MENDICACGHVRSAHNAAFGACSFPHSPTAPGGDTCSSFRLASHAPDQGRAVDEGCGLPQTERRGDWMQTYTGRQYWPLDPRPDDVCMEDIGHHLSMLCRYCGACLRFYSVAEHSVGVLHVVTGALKRQHMTLPPSRFTAIRRHAHLHDAPEAYCHDLIRPIKRCVTGYAEVEAANADAIALRFGLGFVGHQAKDIIKAADNAMLLAEQAVLMAPAPAKWSPIDVPEGMLADAAAFLEANGPDGWTPGRAKAEFLAAWEALAA